MGVTSFIKQLEEDVQGFLMIERKKAILLSTAIAVLGVATPLFLLWNSYSKNSSASLNTVLKFYENNEQIANGMTVHPTAHIALIQARKDEGKAVSFSIQSFTCSMVRAFPCYVEAKVKRMDTYYLEKFTVHKKSILSFSSAEVSQPSS